MKIFKNGFGLDPRSNEMIAARGEAEQIANITGRRAFVLIRCIQWIIHYVAADGGNRLISGDRIDRVYFPADHKSTHQTGYTEESNG